jgi:hypothetical protein
MAPYMERNSYLWTDDHIFQSFKDYPSHIFEALWASKYFSAENTVSQVQFRTEV